MNKYQKEILIKLISLNKDSVKYSEIQLEDIDNDKYNYHLQQLVKTEYIIKDSSSLYSLTTKGTQYIAQLDAQGYEKDTFKVSVITITTRDSENGLEVVLQERKRKPYLGDVTSISGKILPAEKVEDAAKRNFKLESGLDAEFTIKGIIRKIRLDTDGDLLEDIFFHVCHTHNPKGKLITENKYGKNYWGPYEELTKRSKTNKGDGKEPQKIYEHIKENKKDFFYIQEVTTIKDY